MTLMKGDEADFSGFMMLCDSYGMSLMLTMCAVCLQQISSLWEELTPHSCPLIYVIIAIAKSQKAIDLVNLHGQSPFLRRDGNLLFIF